MSGTSPELDAIITDRYRIERQWLADGTIAFTVSTGTAKPIPAFAPLGE